jgi:predicted P-loop ATPase
MTNEVIEYEYEYDDDGEGELQPVVGAVPWPGNPPPADAPEADLEAYAGAVGRWREDRLDLIDGLLIRNDKGVPYGNEENTRIVLRNHPDFHGTFSRDDFRSVDMLEKPVPGAERLDEELGYPRAITDNDITAITAHVQRVGLPTVKSGVVEKVMAQVCAENRFDALMEYFDRCMANWDGVARIGRWHDDYFVSEYEDAYSQELGPITLMALAARALMPGCFLKFMPIYVAPQDVGKSKGLAALCPNPNWFTDDLPDIKSKDAAIQLQGRFIVEVGELHQMKRADINAMKAFVSRNTDTYRDPYGKRAREHPRRVVMPGTTNDGDFLRDETGSTRFYPIVVTKVDDEAIARDRDQLFGEAGVRLKQALAAGEKWWELSPDARTILAQVRKDHEDEDPWTETVLNFVEGLKEVCINQLMGPSFVDEEGKPRAGLDLDRRIYEKKHSHRIGGVLRRNGWRQEGQFTSGKFKGQKRFVPPVAVKKAA